MQHMIARSITSIAGVAAILVTLQLVLDETGPPQARGTFTSIATRTTNGNTSSLPSQTTDKPEADAEGLVFDPARGVFGLWPLAAKPSIRYGDNSDAVRYLQGVLHREAGRSAVSYTHLTLPTSDLV